MKRLIQTARFLAFAVIVFGGLLWAISLSAPFQQCIGGNTNDGPHAEPHERVPTFHVSAISR